MLLFLLHAYPIRINIQCLKIELINSQSDSELHVTAHISHCHRERAAALVEAIGRHALLFSRSYKVAIGQRS